MAQVWLLIIDPKKEHIQDEKAIIPRLFGKNINDNMEMPIVPNQALNVEFKDNDSVYLLFKPYHNSSICIGGGIYACLEKVGYNESETRYLLKLKERYISKPAETIYLSTLPFTETKFTEGLYLIGK